MTNTKLRSVTAETLLILSLTIFIVLIYCSRLIFLTIDNSLVYTECREEDLLVLHVPLHLPLVLHQGEDVGVLLAPGHTPTQQQQLVPCQH